MAPAISSSAISRSPDSSASGAGGAWPRDGCSPEGSPCDAARPRRRLSNAAPARSVAGGAGAGAGAARTDPQTAAVRPADGAPAGGDGLDRQRRCGDARPADPVLEQVLVVAVEAGDVGARAAHVEGDE